MTDQQIEIPDTPRNRAIWYHNQAVVMRQKGVELAEADRHTAYRLLSSAVETDPTFKEGWYELGNANGDLRFREAAIACYRRAIELDPSWGRCLCNLGYRLYEAARYAEAETVLRAAIRAEPDLPLSWSNLSLVESITGRTREACDAAQRAWELGGDDDTELALAFACLFDRQWMRGLLHFESRFGQGNYRHFRQMPYPKWEGQRLDGKVLLLTAEQGMGDALSYLRFVPRIGEYGGQVCLTLHPPLMKLAAGMLMGKTQTVLIGPLEQNIPPADYWCSLTTLPLIYRLTDEEFETAPGLPVPYRPLETTFPWKLPGRKFHVGICWAGDPNNDLERYRAMKVTDFLELTKVPGLQLYSLQIGERARDLYDVGAQGLIKDLAPFIRDAHDTAQIVRDLDLVVTIETSLGHICGAAEVECWVLYSRDGHDYRIGRDEKHGAIWYPRHRVFMQDDSRAWRPVLDRVIEAIRQRILV